MLVAGLEGRCSSLDRDCDQIDVSLNTPVASTIDPAAAPSVPLFSRGTLGPPFSGGALPDKEYIGVPFVYVVYVGAGFCNFTAQQVGPEVDLEDSTSAPVSGDTDSSVSSLIPINLKREDRMTALQASHVFDTHAPVSIPGGFNSGHLRSDHCSVVLGGQGQLVTDYRSVVSTRPCTPPFVFKSQLGAFSSDAFDLPNKGLVKPCGGVPGVTRSTFTKTGGH